MGFIKAFYIKAAEDTFDKDDDAGVLCVSPMQALALFFEHF